MSQFPAFAGIVAVSNAIQQTVKGAAPHWRQELISNLQQLIRQKTVNPPGNELPTALEIGRMLTGADLEPTIVEPYPGRGSVIARIRGDGSRGGPLLLMGHLDVVPAERERWTHDPFRGTIAGGYLYGRGAIDMKATVAMNVQVALSFARRAQRRGLRPSRDVTPGLGRDIILAFTADEETGGEKGMAWIVEHRPDLVSAEVAINEAGGYCVPFMRRHFFPIQVAEKGKIVYRILVSGKPGHAATPRRDNAIVIAAEVVGRLAALGSPRLTDVVRKTLEQISSALPPAGARIRLALDGPFPSTSSDNWIARSLESMVRNTASPDIFHAGVKSNVIPGTAEIVVDCRILPGTTEAALRRELGERLGGLVQHCTFEVIAKCDPIEQPADHPLLSTIDEVLRESDDRAAPIHILAPFSTDARHTHRLNIPTYGFSPVISTTREPFLDWFHGDDERVPIGGLMAGFEVFRKLVERFAASRQSVSRLRPGERFG